MPVKKKLQSGSIIEIPLRMNFGYIYIKRIDLRDIIQKPVYNDLILVYNLVCQEPLMDFNVLINRSLLVGPLFVLDLPPVVKNNTWKLVGFSSPTEGELQIPNFKSYGPFTANSEDEATMWFYIDNLHTIKRIPSDYESVKHLELFKINSHDLIEIRLTMEVLRQKGEDIEKHFKLDNWSEKSCFINIKHTPIYSNVPEEKRGKPVSSGKIL